MGSNISKCNAQETPSLLIAIVASITPSIYNHLEPCSSDDHSRYNYLNSLYSHIDVNEYSEMFQEEGTQTITFSENQLLLIESIIKDKPKFKKAINYLDFNKSRLSYEEEKELITDLKKLEINFGNMNFGVLGESLSIKTAGIANLGKSYSARYFSSIESAQKLQAIDYVRLASGSIFNSASAIADIIGVGAAAKSFKFVNKLENFIIALDRVPPSFFAKAPKALLESVEFIKSNKFKFLKLLIELNFVINAEAEGMITNDQAAAEIFSNLIGTSIPDVIDEKGKSAIVALFIKVLNDATSSIIKNGVKSALEDATFKQALTELVDSLPELIPYAGAYYSQYKLGIEISDKRSNSSEALDAWMKYNTNAEYTIDMINHITNIGMSYKLDNIMDSYLVQINEYHNKKVAKLIEERTQYQTAVSRLLEVKDANINDKIALYIAKDVEFYDNVVLGADLISDFKLAYKSDDSGLLAVNARFDKTKGALVFDSPISGNYELYRVSIPRENAYTSYTSFLLPVNNTGVYTENLTLKEQNISEPITITQNSVKKTGQTISYTTGDDGYYQAGVNHSYTRDDYKEIVSDNITKLQWQDNSDASSITKTWADANTYCENLSLGGFTDWKLPSISELQTIVDDGKYYPSVNSIFKNISSGYYWSSTANAYYSDYAWVVYFHNGGYTSYYYKYYSGYVRCVRAGQ